MSDIPKAKWDKTGQPIYVYGYGTESGRYVVTATAERGDVYIQLPLYRALEAENGELKRLTDRQVKRTGKLTGQVDSLLKENAALREKIERIDKWFADHGSLLASHRLGGFYMSPPEEQK